ncbi:MAG TPA: hypothetical protein VEF72_09200, partial [Mycobacterium sp.]|nr:hypothetical protein [Mycobacterium sp.]
SPTSWKYNNAPPLTLPFADVPDIYGNGPRHAVDRIRLINARRSTGALGTIRSATNQSTIRVR